MTASSTEDGPPAVLLDTSVIIDLEDLVRGRYTASVPLVSAVSVGELAYGVDRGDDRGERAARLCRVVQDYEVLPFGVEEARLYGVLATLVRAAGRNPRPRRLDLQIAATAAAARVPLLTCNPDDFAGTERLVDVVALTRGA